MNPLLAAMDPETLNRIAYWDQKFELAYPLYFWAFGLGALLMLLSVFRRAEGPGSKLVRSKCFQSGLIILLVLCSVSHQTVIDGNRGFIADEERRYDKMLKQMEQRTDKEEVLRAQYLYMPVGDSLAYMTLGNTGIAADYLWLTSMQYVSSNFRRGHKFEMLLRFYNVMLELDPHWIDAELNAGKILSALEPDRFKVEKYYIRAIVENPNDWRLPYGAGRLFVVPPLNLDDQAVYSQRAVGWLNSSMQRKGFPNELVAQTRNLTGLLSVEAGYYEAADAMLLRQATDPEGNQTFRLIAARDWMNVHSIRMARELTDMAAAYKQAHGEFPPDLAALLKQANAPHAEERYQTDAFGYPFDYDRAKGKVESRGVNVRKALTVSEVLSMLIGFYRGAHAEAPPPTLEALRDFVRDFYSNPANIPSAGVKDAIGSDFDPTRSPLGKWDYDPKSGTIKLPEWANVRQLYLRADDVLKMPHPNAQ